MTGVRKGNIARIAGLVAALCLTGAHGAGAQATETTVGDAGAPYRIVAHAPGCSTATAARHLAHGATPPGCHRMDATAQRWTLLSREGDVIALRGETPRAGAGRHERIMYFRASDVAPAAPGIVEWARRRWHDGSTAIRGLLFVAPDTTARATGTGPRHGLSRWLPYWRGALAAGLAMLAGWPVARGIIRWRRGRRARAICATLIARHADTLRLRRRQLLARNSYGVAKPEKWHRERDEFATTILRPALRAAGLGAQWPRLGPWAAARIEQAADGPVPRPDIVGPGMDPLDYEQHCAAELRQDGWRADTTIGSGDQGADIVATRRGLRMVVQCKLYSRTVGNEAVQQVSAARAHYGAAVAVVVSNAPYTRAAQQLARTNGVWLLHHDELRGLSRRLRDGGTRATSA
ncbi:restriction endonuclease [Novacetimonas pomaceti]|uniref:Restriction endonuclease n=1 Tax=Novacetimonas pomaceti TaxID=2021998 RepID=A0ABX5P7K0_9PROT|nr:restriction endonuclease [Novacetimonas pomaceti]PYD49169.1 restriction endonuclease [Novacetimonas pomaceti]